MLCTPWLAAVVMINFSGRHFKLEQQPSALTSLFYGVGQIYGTVAKNYSELQKGYFLVLSA
ncbi:hypothetical protein [Piscirickettsia salmonis]|uniref:hypothetical protein n=1 Tax=Piscirickettsia salmonis TaxID=1238 RepID=UPI0012B9184D|nr:hypothetical protein [Piscirickettsia salmonis]